MNTKTLYLFVVVCILPTKAVNAQGGEEKLLFQSGFEGGTRMVYGSGQSEELAGVDGSVKAPNDWSKFCRTKGYPEAGVFIIFYEGGDSTKRKARLVADPKHRSNTVLRFTIYEPNVTRSSTDTAPYKARIQGQVTGASPGITNYYQSVRMYFPASTMDVLKTYPADLNWYSLAEFWNNAAWGSAPVDPYRLTVGVGHKQGAGNPFYFHFSCDQYRIEYQPDGKTPAKFIPTDVKNVSNPAFSIPADTWLTVEYYYREGGWKTTANRPAGHFYMAVQPEGGKRQVLFNERVATIHPEAKEAPDGLTVYHPLKFYTSKLIAGFMKAKNTPLEILWDDLQVYSNKIPHDEELKKALAHD